ncbi:MAG TPA: hypothetical protein VGH27_20285 [Streptosporangiaceae bacterium]|jgi:hypothetical protein
MSHRSARRAVVLRRAFALAVAAGLVALGSLAPATALVAPSSRSAASVPTKAELSKTIAADLKADDVHSSVTVPGPYMYDPKTKGNYPDHSSVTVSQTTNMVNQFVNVSWTNFTPSNTQGESGGYSGQYTEYPVEVSECAGTDPTDLSDCFGAGQDLQQTFTAAGPTTEVYALTGSNGAGTDSIQIETALQNSTLGCNVSHPCSLLILPVDGGDPGDPPTVKADCSDHKLDNESNQATMAGVTQVGDSTCAWADRIVVPLSFAPTTVNCNLANPAFSVAGSPMLQRAMVSWISNLCLGKDPLNISYAGSTSEYTARQFFLSGQDDVALTTDPASGTGDHPYTYAPVGITAAAFAYWMDNSKTGEPYTGLKMDPRLIAKLITTSYDFGQYACTPKIPNPPAPGCDDAVEHNPENMFSDPEFKTINPAIKPTANDADFSDFPTLLSGNSDMTWEVTRWIAANTAASQFLAGNPDNDGDPTNSGMRVNLNYQNVTFPEEEFETQDGFEAWTHSFSPQFPLAKVVLYQSTNWDPGVSIQPVDIQGQPPSYPANNVEYPGSRDLESILDLADAQADDMPVAALENAKGDYVAPTEQSMLAAVSDMTTNPDGITQEDNEAASNPDAYPWTMVVYAMVPTGGISHTKAAAIARWLDYVAGPGETSGTTPGQLPAGYVPLTAKMKAQTLKAAYDVLHQTGAKPPGGDKGNGSGGGGSTTPSSTPSSSPSKSAGPTAPASSAPAPKANAAFSSPDSSGTGRLVLPLLLAMGALLALAGPTAVVLGKPGGRAAIIAGWRHVKNLPASLIGRIK